MTAARRYYRYHRKYKWAQECTAGQLTIPVSGGNQTYITIVPDSDSEGIRTAKNFEISMCSNESTPAGMPWCFYALIYQRNGQNLNQLNVTSGGANMYEPPQDVITCGTMDFSAGTCVIRSRMARNLYCGDRIVLMVYGSQNGTTLGYTCRYSVCFK